MTKTLRTLLGAALLVGLTTTGASASSLAVGDTIQFDLNPPADQVGRFGIYHAGDPGNIIIWTFCLELNEFINSSDPFYVYGIDDFADAGGNDGGNPDPLSGQTAALYRNALFGDLSGVDGWAGATTAQRRDSIQLAIWQLEDECVGTACDNLAGIGIGNALTGLAANLVAWANSLTAPTLEAALANVDVLNLRFFDAEGRLAQSVLYTTVPEPGSLLLLGTGLVGVARAARRRRTAKA